MSLSFSAFIGVFLRSPVDDPITEHFCQIFTNLVFLEDLDELLEGELLRFEWILHLSLLAKLVRTDRLHHLHDERGVAREAKCDEGHGKLVQGCLPAVVIINNPKELSCELDVVDIVSLLLI